VQITDPPGHLGNRSLHLSVSALSVPDDRCKL
jgi:hypothetical protein